MAHGALALLTRGLLLGLVCSATSSLAQEPTEDEPVWLDEVEVKARPKTSDSVTQEEMQRDDAKDLWEAVQHVPGVLQSGGGPRNASNFSVRGFGADSVPILVDGIVLASPFRGEGDAGRILTGDLERVTIQKGYSSMLLGANTLGGAVVMSIAKPERPFELRLQPAVELDSVGKYAASSFVGSAGTKQEHLYSRLVYQVRAVDHYRLPDSFEPSPLNPQERGDRLWSGSSDRKLTALAGFTPTPNLDLWMTYVYQDADKGLSPPDVGTRDYQIWDWPLWRRHSLSLHGTWASGHLSVKGLAYFDKYDDELVEYFSLAAYKLGVHYPPSAYDEYSTGGHVEVDWTLGAHDELQAGLTWKQESHEGLSGGAPLIRVNEATWSFGAEYTSTALRSLTLVAGLGFDALIPNRYLADADELAKALGASYYVVRSENKFLRKWQVAATWRMARGHDLRLSYARKNHFPTMAQRYSTRFGDVLPNPGLGPEIANHLELGYRGALGKGLRLATSVYYSVLTDKIVNIEVPDPENPSAPVDYARNLDQVTFYGVEATVEARPFHPVTIGAAASVQRYALNKSHGTDVKVMPYYPEVTASAFASIRPFTAVTLIPRVEYLDARYADSAGLERLGAYWLASLKASFEINEHLDLSALVNNIFDRYYEIQRRSPMPGRSFGLSCVLQN